MEWGKSSEMAQRVKPTHSTERGAILVFSRKKQSSIQIGSLNHIEIPNATLDDQCIKNKAKYKIVWKK